MITALLMATAIQILHPDLEPQIDAWLAGSGHSWQQLAAGDVVVGDGVVTAEELQHFLIDEDPVIWVECWLTERTGSRAGLPWQLWDYQRPSMRYRGNTIHECAAEVGKSRDILGKHLWGANTQRGDALISASQDGHIESIYDELLWQLHAQPILSARVDWPKCRVKPYRKMVWLNGNILHLRPGGHDGEALRGLHVGRRIDFDEAAKAKNPKVLGEFFRAALPGCEIGIYSTPDGDRTTRFFELCQQAQVVDVFDPLGLAAASTRRRGGAAAATPSAGSPGSPRPARAPAPPQTHAAATAVPGFAKFRWSKRLMPPPFWGPERRAAKILEYGGIESALYQWNVEGNWGDIEASVFPWDQFAPRCKYIPEYRELLLTASKGELYVVANRLNPSYAPTARIGDELDPDRAIAPQPLLRLLDDTRSDLSRPALLALLAEVFEPMPPGTHLVLGTDCGNTNDPTETLAFQVLGHRRRCVARLQLRGIESTMQRDLILAFASTLSPASQASTLVARRGAPTLVRSLPSHGMGLDATGIGSGLEHQLREGATFGDQRLAMVDLSGFVANARTIDRDEVSGETIPDPRDPSQPKTISFKALGTRLIESAVQRGNIDFPLHPDFLRQFPGHRVLRKAANGERIFADKDDHLVDATRTASLRLLVVEHGASAPDGPIPAPLLPAGSRRATQGLFA